MSLCLVANTYRTLVRYPLDDLRVIELYDRRFPGERDHFRHSDPTMRGHLKQVMQAVEYRHEFFPNTRELLEAARAEDIGVEDTDVGNICIVIYAGAPPDKSLELYRGLDFEIDAAYSAAGHNRNSPLLFDSVGETMIANDHRPLAYLTHNPKHADAVQVTWGKALLCSKKPDLGNGSLYQFNWDDLDTEGIRDIIEFLTADLRQFYLRKHAHVSV